MAGGDTNKEGCRYAGKEYSHGATICSNDEELKCIDGEWGPTGRECASEAADTDQDVLCSLDAAEFMPEEGNAQIETVELKNEKEISAHRFSTLVAAPCVRFVNAGMPHHINIHNTCEEYVMATVRWVGHNYQEDLKYRLTRIRARLIRARGQSGAIIKEEPWNFAYGADVEHQVQVYSTPNQGGTLWTFRSQSSHYVCFKVNIWEDGKYHGYSWGITKPGESMRIYWSFPGVKSIALLSSARAEPM